jgi:hypothetical protein
MSHAIHHTVQGCYEAFKRVLNASHAVNCVPGTQAVSGKSLLIASLAAAYGEAAWGIVPLSFRLPSQYAHMAAHIKQVGWLGTNRAGQDAAVFGMYCDACCPSPPTPSPVLPPPTRYPARHRRPLASSAGAAQRGQLSVGAEGGCSSRQGGGRGHTRPSAGAGAGPRLRWRQRVGQRLELGLELELGRAGAWAQL